jgi:hypothetical protein
MQDLRVPSKNWWQKKRKAFSPFEIDCAIRDRERWWWKVFL